MGNSENLEKQVLRIFKKGSDEFLRYSGKRVITPISKSNQAIIKANPFAPSWSENNLSFGGGKGLPAESIEIRINFKDDEPLEIPYNLNFVDLARLMEKLDIKTLNGKLELKIPSEVRVDIPSELYEHLSKYNLWNIEAPCNTNMPYQRYAPEDSLKVAYISLRGDEYNEFRNKFERYIKEIHIKEGTEMGGTWRGQIHFAEFHEKPTLQLLYDLRDFASKYSEDNYTFNLHFKDIDLDAVSSISKMSDASRHLLEGCCSKISCKIGKEYSIENGAYLHPKTKLIVNPPIITNLDALLAHVSEDSIRIPA